MATTILPSELHDALAVLARREARYFRQATRSEAMYQDAKAALERLRASSDDDLRREIVACDHCGHMFFPLPCQDCPDAHCPKCGECQPSTAETTSPREVAL